MFLSRWLVVLLGFVRVRSGLYFFWWEVSG